jgi:streptogramin lyase
MTGHSDFLQELDRLAREAQRQELLFRDEAAAGIARFERDRQFAFRRFNLAREIAAAVVESAGEDEALVGALGVLAREIGWSDESVARERLGDPVRPVAIAIWRASQGKEANVAAAFADFEEWYASARGGPFLALLDREMPERPLVEF